MKKQLCPIRTATNADGATFNLDCVQGECAWWLVNTARNAAPDDGCCAVYSIAANLEQLDLTISRGGLG